MTDRERVRLRHMLDAARKAQAFMQILTRDLPLLVAALETLFPPEAR